MKKYFMLLILAMCLLSCATVSEQKVEQIPPNVQGVCYAPVWHVGDNWEFRTEKDKIWNEKIVQIENSLYFRAFGKELYGFDTTDWKDKVVIKESGRKTKINGRSDSVLKFPIWIGKTWDYRTEIHVLNAFYHRIYKVAELMDNVSVKAGTFKCYRIEVDVNSVIKGKHSRHKQNYYYCPEVRNIVKYESYSEDRSIPNYELISFKLAGQ